MHNLCFRQSLGPFTCVLSHEFISTLTHEQRMRKRERYVSITSELQAEKCCMCAAIEKKKQLKKIVLSVI